MIDLLLSIQFIQYTYVLTTANLTYVYLGLPPYGGSKLSHESALSRFNPNPVQRRHGFAKNEGRLLSKSGKQ